MEYTVGQVVYSKSGHDGKCRKMDKPKKKKIKHVQITNYCDADLKTKIENGEYLLDADFVKALKRYSSQKQSKAN